MIKYQKIIQRAGFEIGENTNKFLHGQTPKMKMERHPWGFRFSFWKTFKAGGAARRAGVDPPSDAAGSALPPKRQWPPSPPSCFHKK